MRRLLVGGFLIVGGALGCLRTAEAQGRGPTDWMTANGDGQRSSWVRSDSKISRQALQKTPLQLLWKLKLNNGPTQANALTAPALLERLIGYRGFRMLGFFGGSSDRVFVIDTDLGRLEWQKELVAPGARAVRSTPGNAACPRGMTAGIARPTTLTITPAPNTTGSGRSNAARSAVGEPDKGAVTLALVRPNPPAPAATPTPTPTPAPKRINPADPPGGQFGDGPFLIHALSSDGTFHSLHLSNGAEYERSMKFLPPNANATGLLVADNVAYVITQGGCGGVPNGVWALDLASGQVASWKGEVSGVAGTAFGPDGTVYVATGSTGEAANSLVALEPRTLKTRDWYAAGAPFSSSPVLFEFKGRVLAAATTADGRVHILDTGSIGGSDHKTALTTVTGIATGTLAPGALASWQDSSKARWLLVANNASGLPGGFTAANGEIRNAAVIAWKLSDDGTHVKLLPGWVSRNLISPLPPTIINDVVFVTSSGASAAQGRLTRSSPAAARGILYALDSATGKELWNSGAALTSIVNGSALAGGVGQIYVSAQDGTVFAFGYPMEH